MCKRKEVCCINLPKNNRLPYACTCIRYLTCTAPRPPSLSKHVRHQANVSVPSLATYPLYMCIGGDGKLSITDAYKGTFGGGWYSFLDYSVPSDAKGPYRLELGDDGVLTVKDLGVPGTSVVREGRSEREGR